MKKSMGRGQISVEFFLILSIIIAFSVILYNVSIAEVSANKAVNALVTIKSSLNAVSTSVDFVALSGNGSVWKKELFFPKGVNCLYYSPEEKSFYCIVTMNLSDIENKPVYGSVLKTRKEIRLVDCTQMPSGWYEVNVNNSGAEGIYVECNKK